MNRELIDFEHLPLPIKVESLTFLKPDIALRSNHFHDEIEIILIDEGELLVQVENKELSLKRGDTALINSKVVHRLLPSVLKTKITYIQINLDLYSSSNEPSPHILNFIQKYKCPSHITQRGDGELSSLAKNIISEENHQSEAKEAYLTAYIYMLIAYMKRNKLLGSYNEEDFQKLTRLMPSIKYATENYAEKLTIEEISSKINVSKYHFCKLFKSATNKTFSEYINFVRITTAEEILLSSNKTIPEIAFECGFNSVQYFNRVFIARYGYPPFKYKNLKKSIISKKN